VWKNLSIEIAIALIDILKNASDISNSKTVDRVFKFFKCQWNKE